MYRSFMFLGCATIILFGGAVQARTQLTFNAAADNAVPGWQKMEVDGHAVWVNPAPALTSADIQSAQPATDPSYGNLVKTIFTDAGARKMRELTTAQMNKLIAIVLDGKLIFAPKVRAVISNDGIITGKPPEGLTLEQVRRIVASVKQK